MKNTNLINKLKTEPKFRKNAIAITASSLVLVICAVSIPVGLHAQNSKVQQLTESSTSPVSETTTLSADAEAVSVTEPTTLAAAVSESFQTNTKDEQTQNSGSANKDKDTSPSKGGSSSPSGSSGNSSSTGNKPSNQSKPSTKPTTTKAPSTTKKPIDQSKVWTQAKVDAIVAKSRAYGESIGLIWDDSFDLTNSSWQDSIYTGFSNSEQYIYTENEVYEKMKESLDWHKNGKNAQYFKLFVEYNPNDIGNNWAITILWM